MQSILQSQSVFSKPVQIIAFVDFIGIYCRSCVTRTKVGWTREPESLCNNITKIPQCTNNLAIYNLQLSLSREMPSNTYSSFPSISYLFHRPISSVQNIVEYKDFIVIQATYDIKFILTTSKLLCNNLVGNF